MSSFTRGINLLFSLLLGLHLYGSKLCIHHPNESLSLLLKCPNYLILAFWILFNKRLTPGVLLTYPYRIYPTSKALQPPVLPPGFSSLAPSLNHITLMQCWLVHLSLLSCWNPFIAHHIWHFYACIPTCFLTLLHLSSTLSIAQDRWPYLKFCSLFPLLVTSLLNWWPSHLHTCILFCCR